MSALGFVLQFVITLGLGTWMVMNLNFASTPLGMLVLLVAYYVIAAMIGQIPRTLLENWEKRDDPNHFPRGKNLLRSMEEKRTAGENLRPWEN